MKKVGTTEAGVAPDARSTEGADGNGARKRLFLLDGHSLSYRAFFALPETLATTTGQVTNAVYGFTSMLIKLLAEERPDYIAVAFDLGRPKARLERYAEYKAGRRETPDEFRQQLGLILEVVETLQIPLVHHEDQEADDLIATLAVRACQQGLDAVIVTADRDFFQLVRPGISVMFNRKGISDIVRYDVDAVQQRFGLPPEKYLDYVALKGDPSDNIPGIPGVGEKTASQLIQQYGSVEELIEHTSELKPRVRAGIEEAGEQLLLNKEIARLETDLELEWDPDGCRMGEWDEDAVRRLFNSLEFRTLLERLEDVRAATRPGGEIPELDLKEVAGSELTRSVSGSAPVAVVVRGADDVLEGVAVSTGEGRALHVALPSPDADAFLADASVDKWVHDWKDVRTVVVRSGRELHGVAFDTLLASYLLDPGQSDYGLPALSRAHLGTDLLADVEEQPEGQLFETSWRTAAAEAAAVAMLAPVLERKVDRAGLRHLLEEVELPLADVLAGMQARGIALDVPYLEEMSASVSGRMIALQTDIYRYAGEEFNLNSPPQLRQILYEKLGLSPGKKTPKGQLSTDASVLEKLRDRHPIVDALLQ